MYVAFQKIVVKTTAPRDPQSEARACRLPAQRNIVPEICGFVARVGRIF